MAPLPLPRVPQRPRASAAALAVALTALSAELNGVPGPKHALEMADGPKRGYGP